MTLSTLLSLLYPVLKRLLPFCALERPPAGLLSAFQ